MNKRFQYFSLGLVLLALAAVISLPSPGSAQVASATETVISGKSFNPAQVALLYWYSANQTTTFSVGSGPYGVAFDGANIWVANNASNTVTKLRANDGRLLGTFPVQAFPFGLAFDGANIWVASQRTAKVTKLRASDGTTLGTFPVGAGSTGVAFDGTNIWVEPGNVPLVRPCSLLKAFAWSPLERTGNKCILPSRSTAR